MESLFAELTMNGWGIKDLASGIVATDAINLGQLNAIFSSNNTWSGTQTWQNVSEFTYTPVTGILVNHSIGVRGEPLAEASGALVEIGTTTRFDGATTGFFAGSASGTYIAINGTSGSFGGNFLHFATRGTSRFVVAGSGQVRVPTSGSTAGLLLGGDALLYRTSADVFQTPDSLVIDGNLTIGTSLSTNHRAYVIRTISVDPATTATSLRAELTINVATGGGTFLNTSQTEIFVEAGTGSVNWAMAQQNRVRVQSGQTAGTVSNAFGLFNMAWYAGTGTTTVSNLAGGVFEALVSSTTANGTITNLIGGKFTLAHATQAGPTTVSISNQYGFWLTGAVNTGISITAHYGIRIDDLTGSGGTLTTQYGIYLEDLDRGSTNYGMYFAGTSGLARQGIWWNGDTNLYRGAADLLKTDDKFQSMNRFLLGLDMSLIPVASGQSVITSWHALQLKGNYRSTVDHSPANVGGINDASVVIPNQLNTAVGLIIYGATSQSGDLQQWRSVGGGSALIAITAAGLLKLSSQTLAGSPAAGQLEYNGSLYFTDSVGRAKVKLRATVPLTFMAGFTPSGTGADKVFKVPRVNAGSVTFNVRRLFFRVETPSAGTSTIRIEKYTGTGAFSATNMMTGGDLSLTGAAVYEATHTTFSTTTLTSDDKVRVNVIALDGTHANWYVELELEEA